ncbi:hypothetical protein ACUXCC_004843 [Cytobacillus horneckiae]
MKSLGKLLVVSAVLLLFLAANPMQNESIVTPTGKTDIET